MKRYLPGNEFSAMDSRLQQRKKARPAPISLFRQFRHSLIQHAESIRLARDAERWSVRQTRNGHCSNVRTGTFASTRHTPAQERLTEGMPMPAARSRLKETDRMTQSSFMTMQSPETKYGLSSTNRRC